MDSVSVKYTVIRKLTVTMTKCTMILGDNMTHEMFVIVQWVLDYSNPDYLYLNTWTSAQIVMFLAAVGKDVVVTGVLLQEKTKLLYE